MKQKPLIKTKLWIKSESNYKLFVHINKSNQVILPWLKIKTIEILIYLNKDLIKNYQ